MKTTKARIAALNFGLPDPARSRAFYEGMGGSPDRGAATGPSSSSWNGPGWRDFARSSGDAGKPSARRFRLPGFCFSHNITTPDEVNAVLERAKEPGGSVVLEPEDARSGGSATWPTGSAASERSAERRNGMSSPTE